MAIHASVQEGPVGSWDPVKYMGDFPVTSSTGARLTSSVVVLVRPPPPSCELSMQRATCLSLPLDQAFSTLQRCVLVLSLGLDV